LIQALQDNYNVVRYGAAVALGNINDRRSVGTLRQALNDSDGDIRESARRAIDALCKLTAEEAGDI
jgi:HEAT repeat protein